MDNDFEAFVNGRSMALLRTAFFLTGNRHDAEDLLQSALLRTSQHWKRARDNPEPYVRRVLINLARDRQRRFWRRVREVPNEDLRHEKPAGTDPTERFALHDLLVTGLTSLPRRQREVVVLRYLEDLSVQETSDLLGCTEGTVKSQASKGLGRLRGLLADELDPVAAGTPNAQKSMKGRDNDGD